jgi:hypothetical protein
MSERERTEESGEAQEGGDDLTALRREAASWRTKLRAAESERDALTERLIALQRAEVERIASTGAEDFRPLLAGDDVWRDNTELAGLLDDDGQVDAGKVRAAVVEIGAKHSHYLRTEKPDPGDPDLGKGAAIEPPELGFGAALKGAR